MVRMLRNTFPELASSDELWRVRLSSGERVMTLDELDAAFEAGDLDTDTLVCAPGSSEFQRLGAAAGLDPEPQAVSTVPPPMNSMSPMVLSQDPSYARMPMPSLDLGDLPFQKKLSKKLLAIPAGLAVLATIIGIAASASASSATLAAAGEAAKTEMVAPSPAITPPPAAPVAETPATAAAAQPLLTDGQKKLLAAKDKKVEATAKAKRALATPPGKHMSTPKGKGSAPFSKGGNPHDPLNGAI